jgi:hypothetical protein
MHGIRLEWIRYPDDCISAVAADGLTPEQLRHYAGQVGFTDYSTDPTRPMLIGPIESRDDLLLLLEGLGYEVEADEFEVPPAINDIAEQEASR